MKTSDKYYDICFEVNSTDDAKDILIYELDELGFEGFLEDNMELHAYIKQELLNKDNLSSLINNFKSAGYIVNHTISEIEQKNWNMEWEQNFHPVYINDDICIRAPFHKNYKNLKYDLIIYPKMAFGTGHHETTSIVAESMINENFSGKKVLDMGCGTSILAILGSKLGAKEALAIDIDEWAVNNSLENIQLNNINNITVIQGGADILSGNEEFDIIIANINRNILLADISLYVKSLVKSGILLISGFYHEDCPVLINEATKNGLDFVFEKQKNNWSALKFVKK